MPATILITRPDPAGVLFADQLRSRLGCGIPFLLSPLLSIEITGELPDLSDVKTLLFTSRNGVTAFAEFTPERTIPCYCVGDATARIAREIGLEAVSCTGTADDMVARIIADGISGPCLHIRGEHGVGNIATRLSIAGIPTQEAILYHQLPTPATNEAQALLQSENPVVLPLFSPRTARLLFSSIRVTAPVWVVALSENVANEVPRAHSRHAVLAENPDAEAMIDAIEALFKDGKQLEAGIRAQ